MNLMALLDVGSMVSSTAEETIRHMCTRMDGNGTHDMTYQNTAPMMLYSREQAPGASGRGAALGGGAVGRVDGSGAAMGGVGE